ncbi:hypothetical protein JGU71_05020 [Antrihabitans sp. YC3-6]|uniref:Uncharacterized protein n=1 Tax=Antrihabitans stalagmiti TaxID=2799499 RepID=A0A934NN75_9NOCA|nr:DUF6529 family protein [Antrihabitans stalagmiti]MBJ8338240.1 hypothetical protein [Antrihabitans stalagmiti]
MSSDDITVVQRTSRGPSAGAILVPLLIGALVTVALGVYSKVHNPQFFSINVAGFSGPLAVKSWLGTVAAALAVLQLFSAAAIYGKIPAIGSPQWIGVVHVWSGRLAVLATVPVAVHCLYALGFEDTTTRVLVHSLLGCFFYGVFTAKMLLLTKQGLPGWVIPVFGGVVFAGLIGLWLTSSLWFFQEKGITF